MSENITINDDDSIQIGERIVTFYVASGELEVVENCDGYFAETLSNEDMECLIKGLQHLQTKMKKN